MVDEEIQNYPFSSSFHMRGDFDRRLPVLSVTTQVFLGDKSLPELLGL
jgi:hypothetical protein